MSVLPAREPPNAGAERRAIARPLQLLVRHDFHLLRYTSPFPLQRLQTPLPCSFVWCTPNVKHQLHFCPPAVFPVPLQWRQRPVPLQSEHLCLAMTPTPFDSPRWFCRRHGEAYSTPPNGRVQWRAAQRPVRCNRLLGGALRVRIRASFILGRSRPALRLFHPKTGPKHRVYLKTCYFLKIERGDLMRADIRTAAPPHRLEAADCVCT